MNYNYVRMRNALKSGELAKAEEYKLLYEAGKIKRKAFSVLDYTIVILLSVTVLLGIYILYSEAQLAGYRDMDNSAVITSEVPQ